MKFYIPFCIVILLTNILSLVAAGKRELAPDIPQRIQNFPRTPIDYDRNLLDGNERRVIDTLIEASKYIDEIFWRQVAEENVRTREELTQFATGSESYTQALYYFNLMKGRWDRLHDDEPFIGPFGNAGKKPQGAGFYPLDITRSELEQWISAHPEDKEKFQSIVTVIRRKGKNLTAVPYSEVYAQWLRPAAKKLREAASLTSNTSLQAYLSKRADAFLSNDYFESDVAWMDLNSPIEVVIGPYEVYEDKLFNYKASFESFVAVVDKVESDKLKLYTSHLPAMEMNLPLPDEHKNKKRGTESPIRVVQEVYTAGDARRGVMTAAFNLPNDERVREQKGSKKVLLKNVMEAKFKKTGEPAALRVLDPEQAKMLSFDAYFNHTLFHELAHGLGPGIIKGPDGKAVESRLLLKELYSPIEECKADVLGVWNLVYAMDKKILSSFDRNTMFVTYAGLIYRLMRHGLEEAHGKANAIQWNWLREKGAIVPAQGGHFRVVFEKMEPAIKGISEELLMIEATGDYERGKKFLAKYAPANAEINAVISKLKDLPVDIAPVFTAAGERP